MDETGESSPFSQELKRAQDKLERAQKAWEKASDAGSGFNPEALQSEIDLAQREVDILNGVPVAALPIPRERQLALNIPRSLTSETYRFPPKKNNKPKREFPPELDGTRGELIARVSSGQGTADLEDKPGVRETLDSLRKTGK